MGWQLLTWELWVIKMNRGFSLQLFYILDPKDKKKHIIVPRKQRVVRIDNVEDEEVPFFVD
jgi:hypothetical protein